MVIGFNLRSSLFSKSLSKKLKLSVGANVDIDWINSFRQIRYFF